MIFITVGSQKFQFNRLIEKIDQLVGDKVITEEVFAQIGVSDYKPKNYSYTDFLTQEEFTKKIEECSMVITHAGTGVIINSIKKGKKVIGVPRLARYSEHVDDHQVQLIDEFGELGFIEPCYDVSNLVDAINKAKDKEYKTYVSNTDAIVKSIEEFIEKEC